MEKVKFANQEIMDITINGVNSSKLALSITLSNPKKDLVTMEKMLKDPENVNRIELLSEGGEVLRVYEDYTVLDSLEKKLDQVLFVNVNTEEDEPIEEEVRGDIMVIGLRKQSEIEARIGSLEETVDFLVTTSLMEE